jgi:hypothetical protein
VTAVDRDGPRPRDRGEGDRGENGYRRYDEGAPLVVAQIRGLLAAEIGTQTIREVLPCAHGPEPRLEPCPRRANGQRPVDTTSLPATRSCSMSSWAPAISSMV